MKLYFVNDNPQIGGEHEVHTEDCYYLKIASSKRRLGYLVKEIKKIYLHKEKNENNIEKDNDAV